MYHRFMALGGHTCASVSEALEVLENADRLWEIHQTQIGTLYSESRVIREVELLDNTIRIERGQLKRNHYASEFFGIELYGECYLKTIEGFSWLVVPAVCKYERQGKTLAQQDLPEAKPQQVKNPPNRKWSGNR